LPLATAISLQSGVPAIYPRKEPKAYGTRAGVEGAFEPGQTAVVIDDLASSGESKLEAIRRLEDNGLEVHGVVVLIDRQGGARSQLSRLGYALHPVLKLETLVEAWRAAGWIDSRQAEAVLAGVID
jgi:uridine monophosphate synthetase